MLLLCADTVAVIHNEKKSNVKNFLIINTYFDLLLLLADFCFNGLFHTVVVIDKCHDAEVVGVPFAVGGYVVGVGLRLGCIGIEQQFLAPVAVDGITQHVVMDVVLIVDGHVVIVDGVVSRLHGNDTVFEYPYLQFSVVRIAKTRLCDVDGDLSFCEGGGKTHVDG